MTRAAGDIASPARYAVMGHPIGHSKSPTIHAQFAAQFGIRLEYRAIEVAPGGFAEAVARFRAEGGRGLNVTVPFKVDAWRLATRRSVRADAAQAVNTLTFEAGGAILGDNTDGVGLVRDLAANLGIALAGRRILVLGAGGAARGVLGPLLECAPRGLVVANRTVARAEELAGAFGGGDRIEACGFDALTDRLFDVVINATAASLQGEVPPLPEPLFAPAALAYDLMYADRPTPFMRWAAAHGAARVTDGTGMLVEQAAEAFYIWHGVRPATAPVIAALRARQTGGR